jgi:hypothetical protein
MLHGVLINTVSAWSFNGMTGRVHQDTDTLSGPNFGHALFAMPVSSLILSSSGIASIVKLSDTEYDATILHAYSRWESHVGKVEDSDDASPRADADLLSGVCELAPVTAEDGKPAHSPPY